MNKSNPKITYFLGAGASFYSVPIVKDFSEQFKRMASDYGKYNPDVDWINLLNNNANLDDLPTELRSKVNFQQRIHEIGNLMKEYNTIDTLALYYFYTDTKKYQEVKLLMDLFFIYWQNTSTSKWQKIDPRYISLMSYILKLDDQKLVLPNEIKFITWNYDSQLLFAYQKFSNISLISDVAKYAKLYPYYTNSDSEPSIIHLNGIAGVLKDIKFDRFLNYNSHEDSHKSMVDVLYTHYEEFKNHYLYYEENINKPLSLLNFSWDSLSKVSSGLNKSEQYLNNSDYVVIIGYSFPQFNRRYDLNLMKSINPNAKIIIQNPELTAIDFKEMFDIKNKIIVDRSPNQFYVPPDFISL